MQRARYAAGCIEGLDGANVPHMDGHFFKEFVVNFSASGKSVADINAALLKRDIFGGKDLSSDFPLLGQAALFCITEVHNKADIDRLVDCLGEALS